MKKNEKQQQQTVHNLNIYFVVVNLKQKNKKLSLICMEESKM